MACDVTLCKDDEWLLWSPAMSMLSTSPARASTLFSTKLAMSGASATDPVIVHTRLSRQTPSPASSPASSLRSSSAELSKKRKSSPAAPGPPGLPRDVKRLRATPSKGPKRKSSSRSVSRQGSPSPEPIYRSSRSRSTSLFPPSDPETPKPPPRRWRTDEDGVPGPDHLSSEAVVQKLMKSYKTCASIHCPLNFLTSLQSSGIPPTHTTSRLTHTPQITPWLNSNTQMVARPRGTTFALH